MSSSSRRRTSSAFRTTARRSGARSARPFRRRNRLPRRSRRSRSGAGGCREAHVPGLVFTFPRVRRCRSSRRPDLLAGSSPPNVAEVPPAALAASWMPCITRLEVFVVEVHVGLAGKLSACTSPPPGFVDLFAQVRGDDRAVAAVHVGVGERRVGDRHLQRVRQQFALPDREVHVVADRPWPPVRRRCPQCGLVGALACWLRACSVRPATSVGHHARELARQVDPGRLADAELVRLLLDDRCRGRWRARRLRRSRCRRRPSALPRAPTAP